jgi:hypothetical protein
MQFITELITASKVLVVPDLFFTPILVSTIEELLGRNSSGSVLEN